MVSYKKTLVGGAVMALLGTKTTNAKQFAEEKHSLSKMEQMAAWGEASGDNIYENGMNPGMHLKLTQ